MNDPRLIHRSVSSLLGLAALALVVPSLGLGALRPDDRSGPLGAAPVSLSFSASDDVFMRAVARHNTSTSTAIRPDDRSGPLGAEPVTTTSRSVSATVSPVTVANGGFRWLDAAIGAAGVLAFGLILLATVVLQRQHRRGAIAH